MAGYIGSKAVTLSTTAADVAGNAVIDGDLTVKGTTVTIDSAAAQEIRLGDNDKMTFGDATGGDLQIYHDGSHSYVDENGTGQLKIRSNGTGVLLQTVSGENLATFANNAAVNLYYDNAAKLATTSTGVDVNGNVTLNEASAASHGATTKQLTASGNGYYQDLRFSANEYEFRYGPSAWNAAYTGLKISSSGNVGIGTTSTTLGRLTVVQDYASNADTLVLKSPGASGGGSQSGIKFVRNTDATLAQVYADTNSGAFITNVAGSEAMRIDSSGNVGIGTSSPTNKLHVQSSGSSTVALFGDSAANNTLAVTRTTSAPAYIALSATSSVGNLIAGTALRLSTCAADGTSVVERMRIKDSGNVGINEASPASKLHVSNNQSATPIATIENTASHEATIRFKSAHSADSDFRIGASISASNNFEIYSVNASAPRLAIDASGAVSIGTINATRHGQTTKALIYNGSTTTGDFALHVGRVGTGTENQVCFSNGYGKVGSITTSGTSTAYNTSSDYRLKENVTDVTDGITRVKELAPKRFNFIADPDTTVDGFIAHEVQDVIPEAISGTKDAMRDEEYEITPAVEATFDEDGNVLTEAVEAVMGTRSVPDYQGIDQSKLVPLLTAALQEAIAKIETLETEMTSVKARLDALEGN